jgi:hypothetical protein
MALFRKGTEEEKALAAARGDLAAAQKKLDTILGRQDAADQSQDKWDQWTAARDAATSDVTRLTALVSRLEATAEVARREAETAALLKQIETCRAANTAIASRLKDEGARAIFALMTLARDAAAAAAEAHRLNIALPDGVQPITIGAFAARDLPRLPRDVIAAEDQLLWVNASGVPVGDQDAVVEGGDGTGTLQINRATAMTCTKRKFRSTKFRPAFIADQAGYFFSALRLPFPDRPGVAFDGSTMVLQHVAALDVEPPPPPQLHYLPIRTELVPVDPWPPAGVLTEGDRAVTA